MCAASPGALHRAGRLGEGAERRDPECRPRDPRAARWTGCGGQGGCDVNARCQVGIVSIMHGAQALARPGAPL